MADTLTCRALNRATLARQFLLERAQLPVLDAIEHLVGLQGQAPLAPYVGLWTRLDGFRAAGLADLVATGQAVRTHLMRTTVHLASARDALTLGALTRRQHERTFASTGFARGLAGLDLAELAAAGTALLTEAPRTRAELGRELAQRWPDREPGDLAYGVTHLVPVVQVPPRGVWGEPQGNPRWAPMESWLGRPAGPCPPVAQVVHRYLAAFGPATVADVQTWSGLTKLREVTEAMAGQLRVFRGEDGAELLDLPGAPRPDPDAPAPVRFLPEYDNLLLSHADRDRFIPGRRPVPLPAGNGARTGTLLVAGMWRGTWAIARRGGVATLRADLHGPVSDVDAAALEAEGTQLLAFTDPGAASRAVDLHLP